MNWVRTCADWTTGSDWGWILGIGSVGMLFLFGFHIFYEGTHCDPSDWFILHLIMIIWLPCLVFLWKYSAHESILALEHPRIVKAGPALFPLKVFQWRSGTFYSYKFLFSATLVRQKSFFSSLATIQKTFHVTKPLGMVVDSRKNTTTCQYSRIRSDYPRLRALHRLPEHLKAKTFRR